MKNNCIICLILFFALTMSGCSSLSFDEPCDVDGAVLIESIRLQPSVSEQVVRFQPSEPGAVCARISRANERGDTNGKAIEGDARTRDVRIVFGNDPTIGAFSGGSQQTEWIFRKGDWFDDLNFWEPAPGSFEAFVINNPGITVDVDIFDIPGGGGGGGGGESSMIDYTFPEVECLGRLRGFRDIDDFGSDAAGYREIRRSMVGVKCSVSYVVFPSNVTSQKVTITSSNAYTDEQGRYRMIIPETTKKVLKSANPPLVSQVIVTCTLPEVCGFEASSIEEQTNIGIHEPEAPRRYFVDVTQVLDITSHGPAVVSSDGRFGPRLMLGARLISAADSFPEMNDKPFVIHEQLDAFNVEHTNFLLWGLAGQPVRTTFTKGGKQHTLDPRTSPCDADPLFQYCTTFSGDCNPSTCDQPGRACLEDPLLLRLIEAGYDVWLVDHLRGQEDIAHIAASAPLLYQKIANYGAGNGLFLDLPAVDPHMADTFQASADVPTADQLLYELEVHTAVARPLPDPPEPVNESGRIIVAGFSLGGVVSRIGLRLWEISDQLPHASVVDFDGDSVTLATSPQVFMEDAADKVALYISLDAPHRGITIPTSLQAYVRRVSAVLDTETQISESDKAQLTRAIAELDAKPTRQLLRQEIDADRQAESLGCWSGAPGDRSPASRCYVDPFDGDMQARIVSDRHETFVNTWLGTANNLAPASVDGLPATIPSIAISNGELGPNRRVSSARILNAKFDINNARDRHHRLCDTLENSIACRSGNGTSQLAGSQWNNTCARLSSVPVGHYMDDMFTGSIFWSLDNLWNNLKGFGLNVFNIKLREIEVTYPMRPRFDSDGDVRPNTGFPTIVPTSSSLLTNDGFPSSGWRDAHWQETSEYHTNIDDETCKTILFYADGAMTEDEDGWPACTAASLAASCEDGGRHPGRILGSGPVSPTLAPCDCAPNDDSIYPGAPDVIPDGVDNDCDGTPDDDQFVADPG